MSRRHRKAEEPLPKRAFYFVEEVAAILGISPWTAFQMNDRGEVPGSYRVGVSIRINKAIFNAAFGLSDRKEDAG
jgi:hypothetical protein